MATDHPFQQLFESFGRLPAAHAESVNRKAGEALADALDRSVDAPGRCILLRAPRAGHGKTHLLSRMQYRFGGSHEFIPLHASGNRVDALSVTEDALNRLGRSLPASGGLTVLDLVIRRLFAYALQPLVVSGEVPCQDREGALTALRSRPVETFDFHHPNAVTAHWAKENFDVLGPRLSMELSQRGNLPIREVAFWVNALFRYASTPIDHPSRAGVLNLEVTGETVTGSVAMERLTSLLGMLSLLMRVVLVADDLEGFSADESAALKFSAFVTGVRQAADRVDVVLSLNQDVWENAFLPRLSGGLADRLSEVLIELEPLTDDEIVALLDSRAPGLGAQVFERIDGAERHPRALVRAAGIAWVKAAEEQEQAARNAALTATPALTEDEEPAAKMEAEMELEAAKDLVESTTAAETAPQAAFTAVYDDPPAAPPVGIFESVSPSPAVQWGSGSVYEAHVVEEPTYPPSPAFAEPSTAGVFQPVYDDPEPPNFPPAESQSSVHPAYGSTPSEFAAAFEGPPFKEPARSAPVEGNPPEDGADRVDDLLKQFRERYGR
jgi:hypothetical protein